MSHFIHKYSDSLLYIDTDGIKCRGPIDPSEIGPELGLMKDEGDLKEGVFLAPKVYGGINMDNSMLTKVKGLKTGSISY